MSTFFANTIFISNAETDALTICIQENIDALKLFSRSF